MDRTPSHETFSRTLSSLCTHHRVAQGVARRVCIKHVHMSERLLFPWFVFFLCLSCLYVLSHFYLLNFNSIMSRTPSIKPKAHPQNEEYCPVAIYNPLTGYEPHQLDNFDYSEAFAAIFQDGSVDIDTELSYSCDAELDDELIGKAKSSPLFNQEREEPANLRQTYHSHEESLLPAQSFFTRTSTGRPVYEPSSNLSQERKSSRDSENERIRILLERQKEQILAEVRSRSTNFKPSLIKEVCRNQPELLILSEFKLIIPLQGVSNRGEINYYFKKNYQNKIGIFVKLVSKVFMRWKN